MDDEEEEKMKTHPRCVALNHNLRSRLCFTDCSKSMKTHMVHFITVRLTNAEFNRSGVIVMNHTYQNQITLPVIKMFNFAKTKRIVGGKSVTQLVLNVQYIPTSETR